MSLATSPSSACALDDRGEIFCWGAGFAPQPVSVATDASALIGVLTNSTGTPSTLAPAACHVARGATVGCGPVTGRALTEVVDLGYGDGCAILADRTVGCWELRREEPFQRVASVTDVTSAAFGFRMSCVVDGSGAVSCWGRGVFGREGIVPIALPAAARSVAVGGGHACAALIDGRVACWGDSLNGSGEYGVSERRARPDPVLVPGIVAATQVAADDTTSCAIEGGRVLCWGSALVWDTDACAAGGRGPVPRVIAGLEDVQRLALGHRFGCALDGTGTIRCFGRSEDGALGDGTRYSTWASTVTRAVRLEHVDDAACLPNAARGEPEPHTANLAGDVVHFCVDTACYGVDLTDGRFAAMSPVTSGIEPGAAADDGWIAVVRDGRQCRTCDAAEVCTARDLGADLIDAIDLAAVDAPELGLVIVYGWVPREEERLVLRAFDRRSGVLRWQTDLEGTRPQASLLVLGQNVVLNDGDRHELLDVVTGRRAAELHRTRAPIVVYALADGAFALTDTRVSYVEHLAADGSHQAVEFARSGWARGWRRGDELVILRGAPVAGNVEIRDLGTGALRAEFSPPTCEPIPPLDPCPAE